MTMRKIAGLSGLLMLATLAGGTTVLAAADYGPLKMMKTSVGEVLTTPKGMTLYTFDKDTAGTSTCYGECSTYWPPLMADKGAKPTGVLTLINRSDGTMQMGAKREGALYPRPGPTAGRREGRQLQERLARGEVTPSPHCASALAPLSRA